MTDDNDTMTPPATGEVRFGFGENWRRFLDVLDESRIGEAERSLREMLECDSFAHRSFLDLGSGSGLFSLAALRLGAERVHSLDLDKHSVGCTQELRSRYAADVSNWSIEQASVLDRPHLESLGQFDIVYSWGVLHHTGQMWTALDNAAVPVAPGGRLFVAIYNDQGRSSRRWVKLKRFYNQLPVPLRVPYVIAVMAPREAAHALRLTLRREPLAYIRSWTNYKRQRGMSRWHDLVDWVGGYPFEVARPDEIFDFYRDRGFQLERLITNQGQNQFVFRRV